jgi:hypothetical protein
MSWSFYAVGKPAAILNKARTELERIKCSEPEETIKNKVLDILVASLLAMPASSAISVKASGSQSSEWKDNAATGKQSNTLILQIEPLYGFVEDDPASMGGA